MKDFVWVRRGAGALLVAGLGWMLAACGGSGPGAAGGGGGSSVSTLSASPTRYNALTVITVNGQALDQNIQLDGGEYCVDMTRLSVAGNELTQSFQCRLIRVGEHNFRVRDANGRQMASLQIIVPAPQVTITTGKGAMVIELDVPSSPTAVNHFLALSTGGTQAFYRNTFFHRIAPVESIIGGSFVLSGGAASLKPSTRGTVPLENSGLKNLRGTVALLPDAAGGVTSRGRFIINLRDLPDNDWVSAEKPGAVVFGRVVSGLEIAELISNDPTLGTFFDPINVQTPVVTITDISQTR